MDYIKLGMAMAEYREACAKINKISDQASRSGLQSAFSALLAGDYEGRDRNCGKVRDVPRQTYDAKIEIGLRIAEKYGVDRDVLEREINALPRH